MEAATKAAADALKAAENSLNLPEPRRSLNDRKRVVPEVSSDVVQKKNSNITNPKRSKRNKNKDQIPNVTPQQRVNEFPNNNFAVQAGTLFCRGCREELRLKKSAIKDHTTPSTS
jgi:hypothetical protein